MRLPVNQKNKIPAKLRVIAVPTRILRIKFFGCNAMGGNRVNGFVNYLTGRNFAAGKKQLFLQPGIRPTTNRVRNPAITLNSKKEH
jgi:hypothetical protein